MRRGYEHALTIPGWMDDAELQWLYSVASQMQSVVEIGCWCGRSTWALARGCPGIVFAVDHWKGGIGWADSPCAEARRTFMQGTGQLPNVKVVEMESTAASLLVPDVDMVFIDGGHDYQEIRRDLDHWCGKARKIICGHDYAEGPYPGVVKAVGERFIGQEILRPAGFIWAVFKNRRAE